MQGESAWAAHLAASGRSWPEVGGVRHAAVGCADAGDAVRGEGGDPQVRSAGFEGECVGLGEGLADGVSGGFAVAADFRVEVMDGRDGVLRGNDG